MPSVVMVTLFRIDAVLNSFGPCPHVADHHPDDDGQSNERDQEEKDSPECDWHGFSFQLASVTFSHVARNQTASIRAGYDREPGRGGFTWLSEPDTRSLMFVDRVWGYRAAQMLWEIVLPVIACMTALWALH
jgi:hypothetical protein